MRSLKIFCVHKFLLNKFHQYSTIYCHFLFHFQESRRSNKPVHRVRDLRLSSRNVSQGNYIRKFTQGEGHGIQRRRGIRFFVQRRKGLSDSRQAGRVGIALAGEDNRCGPEREIVSRLSGP